MIHASAYGFELLPDAHIKLIGRSEIVRLLAETDDLSSKRGASCAALRPDLAEHDVHLKLTAARLDHAKLRFRIARKRVYRYDARQAENVLDIADMA